jgi:DNA repair exonuclease SbcCD ATPase subunit
MKLDTRTSGVSLHFEKHKANDTAVNGLQRHNERVPGQKHSNERIDDSRTADNVFLKKSDSKFNKSVNDVIENERKGGTKGVRKDAVRMVEATVQLSGKVLDMSEYEQEQVLRDSYEWLKDKFGEDNVISAVIHKDETNMHLHFDFVPIENGKLNAKAIISKPRLKQYQTDFLKNLKENHVSMNFERGGGETNGLSQRDFEVMQKEREKLMQEIAERENELDAREDKLDLREDELSDKEEKIANLEEKYDNAVKEFNERVNEFKVEKTAMIDREGKVSIRERALERDRELLRAKEVEVDKKHVEATEKLSEATEKLSEASRLKELADKTMERVKALKSQLANKWTDILQQVRGGALRPSTVEEKVEPYVPVTDENVQELMLEMDNLLDKENGQGLQM